MAVDSAAKRFSILNLSDVWQPPNLVPTGTIGQAERQQLLWGYYGILWDTPSTVVPVEILEMISRITTTLTFDSEITTQEDMISRITTTNTFKSEVY